MCLSISKMEVHGSVGEGVALSVRVVVREWRVVHRGVTVQHKQLGSRSISVVRTKSFGKTDELK